MSAIAENQDRFSDLMNRFAAILAKCVLPVLYLERGRAFHAGTGFLVATSSNHYLISAGHVFDSVNHKERELFIFVGDKKIRKLAGNFRRLPDPVDVGVFKFSNEYLPPYPEVDKYSLKIQSLSAGLMPRQDKQYIITGFPASRTKFDWRSKQGISELRSLLTGSVSNEVYESSKTDPNEHLLLNFHQKDSFFLDGTQMNFPDPHGLSGSPVWLNFDRVNDNDPALTPLVGVVTEHDPKKKFIKAYDIGFALHLIDLFEAAV